MFAFVPGALEGLEESVSEVVRQGFLNVPDLLHAVGREVVRQLADVYGGPMRPPAYKGGPMRPAHLLGRWGDITGQLKRGFRYEVQVGSDWAELHIINDDPGGYGAILDMRQGFMVLRGITDPGGPVDVILRTTIRTRFPDWTLTAA